MKTKFAFAAIIAASLTLTSCGLGTTSPIIQSNNQGILGGAIQQNGQGLLTNILSNLLGNTTTQNAIVGSWTYASPKVVFESENILSQLGGQVVSNSIEQKLGTQLEKMGLTAGQSTLTLNADQTCTFTRGTHTTNGTWAYDANTHKLTLTGALGVGQMTCTVSVVGNQMAMLFDADKLLTVATNLQTKSTSTLSSLLKNYNGLKLGWTMTK